MSRLMASLSEVTVRHIDCDPDHATRQCAVSRLSEIRFTLYSICGSMKRKMV